jgi:hypothetical protein
MEEMHLEKKNIKQNNKDKCVEMHTEEKRKMP